MTAEPLTLPLGTRVRVRRVLVRTRRERRPDRPGGYTRGEVKAWASHPVSYVFGRASYLDGIIAGHRTLTNGTTVWGGEDGTDYRATESVPAYLVAWHPRRELVRVRPQDLEVIPWPGALDPQIDAEPDPRDVLL